MKKLLFLFLTFLTLTGCQNDDDRAAVASGAIVGSWKLSTYTNNGELEILSDCEKKSTITFRDQPKSFTVVDYGYFEDVCESDSFDGTWVNTAGNAYKMSTMAGMQDLEITVTNNMLNITFNDGTDANPYYVVSTYTKI